MFSRQKINLGWVLLAAAFLCWLRFPDFLPHGNTRYIEPYGDGFKNYAVLEYHVAHDSSYRHYGGMNYPFGEHIVSADGQPLLANALLWVKKQGWIKDNWVPGVIHSALVLSILLAVGALFWLLASFGLSSVTAGVAALGIVFLSPQMARITAHYGLAQVAALPVLLGLLYRYQQKRSWGRSLAIAFTMIIFALLHFYFFVLLGAVIALWHGMDILLQRKRWRGMAGRLWHLGVQLGLPVLFFYLWLFAPDTVGDRSEQPWGFFHYRARLSGLLTSSSQPWFDWLDTHVLDLPELDFEAANYLGLSGIMGLLLMGYLLWSGCKHISLARMSDPERFLVKMGGVAVLLLLFALGLPFTIPGLEHVYEYIGPLRQFRSLGRFAWPFYYVVLISVVYVLSRYRQKLIWPALVLLCVEAFFFQRSLDLRLDSVQALEGEQRVNDLAGIRAENYQAILTIPYYNVGSDNFWWSPEGFILQQSLLIGTQLGLPVTSTLSSRSSLGQAWEQLQLVGPPYRLPVVLEKYPDKRPLLVVWDQREYEADPEKYSHFLPDLVPLYEGPRLKLFSLSLSGFRERIARVQQEVALEIKRLPGKVGEAPVTTTGEDNYYFESYATTGSAPGYPEGKGQEVALKQEQVIMEDALPFAKTAQPLIVSFWAFLNRDLAGRVKIRITEKAAATGQVLQQVEYQLGQMTRVWDPNGWGLVECAVAPTQDGSTWVLELRQSERRTMVVQWDELLIRPAHASCYRKMANYLWKNNRWYSLSGVRQ